MSKRKYYAEELNRKILQWKTELRSLKNNLVSKGEQVQKSSAEKIKNLKRRIHRAQGKLEKLSKAGSNSGLMSSPVLNSFGRTLNFPMIW